MIHELRRILAVALDHRRKEQSGQQAQMKINLGVVLTNLAVYPFINGAELLLGLCKTCAQFLLVRALLQKFPQRFLIELFAPLQAMVKAGTVLLVHTVIKPMVGAGRIG